jgi:hypothetical protein
LYTEFLLELEENDTLTERVLLAAAQNENTYCISLLPMLTNLNLTVKE